MLRSRSRRPHGPSPSFRTLMHMRHESHGQTALAPAVSPSAPCPVWSRGAVGFERESRSGGTPRADSKLHKLAAGKDRNGPLAERSAASRIQRFLAAFSDPRHETDASPRALGPDTGPVGLRGGAGRERSPNSACQHVGERRAVIYRRTGGSRTGGSDRTHRTRKRPIAAPFRAGGQAVAGRLPANSRGRGHRTDCRPPSARMEAARLLRRWDLDPRTAGER